MATLTIIISDVIPGESLQFSTMGGGQLEQLIGEMDLQNQYQQV